MGKKKIVWICSFANKEIANIIGSKEEIFAAPWITELIQIFRNKNDIDLTIISPNYYENKARYFTLDNIKVYLYKYRSAFLPYKAYNLSFNYNISKKSILNIIEKIKPDLIDLQGSENPLYSIAILPLMDKYPVLITIQGFVSLSSRTYNPISNYIRWNRIRIEQKINKRAPYFSVSTGDAVNYLRQLNKNAVFFDNYYPTTKPDVSADDFPEKKYDVAFFARISKDKGIEDFISVIKILKNKYPAIKAVIIGGGNAAYVESIISMIKEYGLHENINFAGFQPSHQDAFKLVAQAKVSVLPTYFDAFPGSIREAMFMKVPVVAYAVGGIPFLNNEKECIALVEKQNIPQLVDKVDFVLNNKEYSTGLVENAYEIISNKFDNGKIYNNMINIYNKILDNL